MAVQSGLQILGYILIPLGLICLFLNVKYLLYLTVFFSGFTATSIVNFGRAFTLTPAYFFGVLFIFKYIFVTFKNKKIIKPNKLLCFFILLCTVSIFMPNLIHNKNVFVINQDSNFVNISFTSSNITQLIYLIFCFIIYWLVDNYLYNNSREIENIVKILLYSTAIICLLGIYQEFAYLHDLPFDKFFRSALHGNTQTSNNFIRVYSVAQEPSMLAYFLIPMLALSLVVPKKILKHKLLLILIILIIGLISTSTTFMIGIIVLLFKLFLDKCILFIKNKKNKNQKIGIILPLMFVLLAIIVVAFSYNNADIINAILTNSLNKLQGNGLSGMERTNGFQNHIKIALQYPFLGIGFGTARSKDLLSTWLCNTGFIATGIFIIYLYKIITKLKYTNKIGYGISNYIFVLFVCAFIAVPEPYYLFIWIMFAIGENLLRRKKNGILEQDDAGYRKLKITWGK